MGMTFRGFLLIREFAIDETEGIDYTVYVMAMIQSSTCERWQRELMNGENQSIGHGELAVELRDP